jgi:hypothetical protein
MSIEIRLLREGDAGEGDAEGLLQVGSQLNCTEAWVLTDRAHAAARDLYSSAGGTEGVVGYSFPREPQR